MLHQANQKRPSCQDCAEEDVGLLLTMSVIVESLHTDQMVGTAQAVGMKPTETYSEMSPKMARRSDP